MKELFLDYEKALFSEEAIMMIAAGEAADARLKATVHRVGSHASYAEIRAVLVKYRDLVKDPEQTKNRAKRGRGEGELESGVGQDSGVYTNRRLTRSVTP